MQNLFHKKAWGDSIVLIFKFIVMKMYAKIRLWSFLVFGILFLFIGVYLQASGSDASGTIKAMLIAGTGQIVIFNVILFGTYKGKLKEKQKQ